MLGALFVVAAIILLAGTVLLVELDDLHDHDAGPHNEPGSTTQQPARHDPLR